MKARLYSLLIGIVFLFLSMTIYGQTYIMGATGTSITDCEGTIENPGGYGFYSNGLDVTQTICSGNGQYIQLSFGAFDTEACCDPLTIYDGNSTSSTILGTYSGTISPGVITSTGASGGCVTLSFSSNASGPSTGFFATISCIPNSTSITLGQGDSTISECIGLIMDPGGFSNYPNNQSIIQTFCSDDPEQCVSLTFTEFMTELNADILTIYDGPNTSADLLGSFSGSNFPNGITSSSNSTGCLTLKFISNASINHPGFQANIWCGECNTPNLILGQGGSTINTCGGTLLDTGVWGFYGNNENITQTFCSADSGQCLTLTFSSFNTEADVDVLTIYDGPSTNSTIIAQCSGFQQLDPITSSSESEGCLTLSFFSNGLITRTGFRANLSCGNCQLPNLILGQGGDTLYTCGGTIVDPGSSGYYEINQNVTQTICSGIPGQCIALDFTSFKTEAVFDRLTIYDGPSIESDTISVFSGNTIPYFIQSSSDSEGCLTLVFTTNQETNFSGFSANISCVNCNNTFYTASSFCHEAQALCKGIGINYEASTLIESEFGTPGSIGCISSTLNPAWFYLQIQESGPIDIEITSEFDVDFICWGPFNHNQWDEGVCSLVLDPVWANNDENSVSCSYSGGASEYCNISNAQSGEYYMLLISNFSNQSTLINIQQFGGIGTTNCSSLCDHTINTLVTECDSSDNTYSINCTINIPHPPFSGTMEIINSSGGILSFEAPFPDSLNFSFDHLASDGLQQTIEVSFSDQPNCTNSFQYTAPIACNACAVSASLLDSVSCTGFPIHLQASELPSVTYSWIGPNGFTSSEQNPIIANAELNMNGVYQLDVYNPIDSCHSIALVNVLIHQFPVDASMTGNEPVCSGGSIILDVPDYSNAIYTWTKSDSTLISSSSSTYYLQPAILQDMGIYSCTINIDGCINTSQDEEVIIYNTPLIPYFDFNPLTNELYAMQTAGNFQWFLNNVPIIGQTQYHIHLEQQGNYSVTVSNDFGCVISSENFYFDPTGIPELPISRLALQPNPAKAYIQVLVPELGVLEVFDLAGKRLKEYKLQLGVNTISVNELAEGIYLFQFHSNSGVRLAKVIVEHN